MRPALLLPILLVTAACHYGPLPPVQMDLGRGYWIDPETAIAVERGDVTDVTLYEWNGQYHERVPAEKARALMAREGGVEVRVRGSEGVHDVDVLLLEASSGKRLALTERNGDVRFRVHGPAE